MARLGASLEGHNDKLVESAVHRHVDSHYDDSYVATDRGIMADTTLASRAQVTVERMLHDAHRRYQRQQLSGDSVDMPSAVIRGERREPSKSELKAREFKPEWFTHLRSNFWKAYFETLMVCAGDQSRR